MLVDQGASVIAQGPARAAFSSCCKVFKSARGGPETPPTETRPRFRAGRVAKQSPGRLFAKWKQEDESRRGRPGRGPRRGRAVLAAQFEISENHLGSVGCRSEHPMPLSPRTLLCTPSQPTRYRQAMSSIAATRPAGAEPSPTRLPWPLQADELDAMLDLNPIARPKRAARIASTSDCRTSTGRANRLLGQGEAVEARAVSSR